MNSFYSCIPLFKLSLITIQFVFSFSAYPQQLLGISNMPLLGAGIKFNLTKPSLKTCLSDSEEISVGKEINTQIHFLEEKKNYNFGEYEINMFVKKNLDLIKTRSKRVRKKKLSSFLVIIDIDKNIGFKSINKLSFQKDIEKTLHDKNYDLFFQECGDSFIESLKKRSRLLLFVSFYGTRIKDRWIMKKTIRKRITYDLKDSFQLNLFKDFEYNSFFHLDVVQKGTKQYMDILYGVDKWKGQSLDDYIKIILKKSLDTENGYLLNFQKRKWNDLPLLLKTHNENRLSKNLNLLQLKSRKFLQRLTNDLFLFKSKKIIAQKQGRKSCYSLISKLEKVLNWDTFSTCKINLLSNSRGNTAKIKECHDMKIQFRTFFEAKSCQNLKNKDPLLSPFIYQEKILNVKGPDQKIQIGLGMDSQGKKYKNCLKNLKLPYITKTNNE